MFKRGLAALLVSGLLAVGVAGPAAPAGERRSAQQDGLINIVIKDVLSDNKIVLKDINVAVAALVAANICGVKVGPIAILAVQVDASGAPSAVCRTGEQTVRFVDNS